MIYSFSPRGFEGDIVSLEVDIRRGIPGIDIVGLPDNAVKEARERVKIALKNNGFSFPIDRILINMAPAGVKKAGAGFDLPLAAAILMASDQIEGLGDKKIMVLGELQLSGAVRSVKGVLPAVAAGLTGGIDIFIVPEGNVCEARSLKKGAVYSLDLIENLPLVMEMIQHGMVPAQSEGYAPYVTHIPDGDISDIKGHNHLKRALEIGAAGRHNMLLFGPPGSGKTMAAKRFTTLLPELSREEAVEVTRVWSLAGKIPEHNGLIQAPPFRTPHHSASLEGLTGGGKEAKPGEISLAHKGVLFLDETPEFKKTLLQSLREPIEDGMVVISRAGSSFWYPADFQLILAANPCPCGNMGREEGICVCNIHEIQRYWRKIGGALLDRIDIRVPVKPISHEELLSGEKESVFEIKERINNAIAIQAARYRELSFSRNGKIQPGYVQEYCKMDEGALKTLTLAAKKLFLSSRACHSVLKIARTIADLDESGIIAKKHVLEAVLLRRYGDKDFFWIN